MGLLNGLHLRKSLCLSVITTQTAFQLFAYLIIVQTDYHTEVCAMSENVFVQEKKNNNTIVVTCDFVLPHKLTVVAEHTVTVNLLPANIKSSR
jgi:hypothetical protein